MSSKFLKHVPCEKCGSSDANSLFDDGHTYCYSCLTYKKGNEDMEVPEFLPKKMCNILHKKGEFKSIADRGITKDTCQKYGVTVDDVSHYYPFTDSSGVEVATKVRNVAVKTFNITGNFKEATLFGQSLFSKAGKFLTICEGELDALAAYQMMGSKYPVVSVRNGAQAALKDCKEQYDYINSFEGIVLCFDNDTVGKEASDKVAELFGAKVRIFRGDVQFKDACDYLRANKSREFVDYWWKSEQWQPDGIISAELLREDLKKPLSVAPVLYPWEGLNKMLYGIRMAELVTLTAGSGLGKSTMLREFVIHILKNTNEKVGLAFLEETPERTMRGLVGLEMNKKIHLPDAIYEPSEIDAVYKSLDIENRVFLWDHFGSNAIENVLNRLKYFVKALDCKFLVLDHLSILVSDQAAGDERKNIDLVMTKLRMFVQEMNCSLLLVSHLKRPEGKSLEDGAATSLGMLRGSGSIAQLSDAVIGAERNSQAEDLVERNTTKVRVLKSRYTGYTGHACDLLYSDITGRLKEIRDIL